MNSERALQIAENSNKINSFEFAEFSFDIREKILRRGTETVPMPPKTCDLLAVLIANHGRLLGKEELFEKVWADTFVEEANLSHHIRVLRKTLGEDGNDRKFIETVPRRGYRFVAPVHEISADADGTETVEITMRERVTERRVEQTEIEQTDDEPAKKRLPAGHSRLFGRKMLKIFAGVLVLVFLGAIGFLVYRQSTASNTKIPAEAPKASLKRLTPDADSFAPAVSPDGASIAFLQIENGRETLWRKNIATGEMTQLLPTAPTAEAKTDLTRYSPDGKWLYYIKRGAGVNGTIYRIPAGGGAPQQIKENVPTDFSFSPDGKRVAFTRDFRELIVADVETGAEMIVARRDGVNKTFPLKPVASIGWSPDGTRLICGGTELIENRHTRQLVEVDIATGAEKLIPFEQPNGASPVQIEWSPDGKFLLATLTTQVTAQLWRISYPDGAAERLSGEIEMIPIIRLSADGKTLIAEQAFGHYNIFIAPADRLEQKQQITVGAAAFRGTGGVAYLAGGKIVYSSGASGKLDLWIMNEDGSDQRNLTPGAGNTNTNPHATRDGRYIVFNSTRSGMPQVWRIDSDGRNPVQLSRIVEAWDATLAPDDEVFFMTFLPDQQRYQLYRVPVEGGEAIEVNDYYYLHAPVFSPDGKWMIVNGAPSKDEKPGLFLLEAASKKVVRRMPSVYPAQWTPDSKSFYYRYDGDLWRQEAVSGKAEKLSDFYPLSILSFDFSPDGKKMVFALGNTSSEIVAVQNFRGADK